MHHNCRRLAMISVRQACQDLADGDGDVDASEAATGDAHRAADEDVPLERVAEMDVSADTTDGSGGREKGGAVDGGAEGGFVPADEEGEEAGVGGVEGKVKGDRSGEGNGGDVGGGGEEDGGGGGVPLSVCCSEDGRTVAVVVSG